MLSDALGPLLKSARQRLGLSREALASKADVSARLVAEFERGQRHNVSLETALRLLKAVGITVSARTPHGPAVEIRGTNAERLEREARAEHRRKTWTVRRVSLRDGDDPPVPQHDRIRAVAEVSRTAYAFADAGRPAAAPAPRAPRVTRKHK